MYVTHATLKNFRCLKDLKISFACEDRTLGLPNVTLLVGRNGSGKTSILRGLVIALVGWALEGYRSYFNVRNGTGHSRLVLRVKASYKHERPIVGDGDTLEQAITSYGSIEKIVAPLEPNFDYFSEMQKEQSPLLFVAGYGAARRVETGEYDTTSQERLRHARYRRVASLLEPQYTLIPLSAWFPKLTPRERKVIGDIINKLLPEGGLTFDSAAEENFYFIHRNQKLPLLALSDGYQAFLGWVFDLLHHLHACSSRSVSLDKISGLVLVDEIDLHLHPTWQQEVIGKLSRAFPMLQFVFTTHSPLVVGSVERGNVRILQEVRDTIRVTTPPQEVRGLTSDQILLSPSFGLVSVREARFMEELKQTEEQARSGDPEAALKFNRMVAFGAAAMAPASSEDVPEWVREAAARKRSSEGGT